jgi:hypothetical protein
MGSSLTNVTIVAMVANVAIGCLVTKVTNVPMVTMVTGAHWLLRLLECAGSVLLCMWFCHLELLTVLLVLMPSFVPVFLFCVFCICVTLADVSLCAKNTEFVFVIAYTCSFTVVIRQSRWRMKIQTAHS